MHCQCVLLPAQGINAVRGLDAQARACLPAGRALGSAGSHEANVVTSARQRLFRALLRVS